MRYFTLLAALIGLLLSSCSSDETPIPECGVATVTYQSTLLMGPEYHTYDSKGRVKRIDINDRNSEYYQEYSYEADRVLVTGTTIKEDPYVYFLDEKGRIKNAFNSTYSYDTEGYLSEIYSVSGEQYSRVTFTYVDGNLHSIHTITTYATRQPTEYTQVFEYTEELAEGLVALNPLNDTKHGRGVLSNYLGKASKNLVAKKILIEAPWEDQVTPYTYTRDELGRVISVHRLIDNIIPADKFITYSCF